MTSNGGIQLLGLDLLLAQRRGEALHLFFEGLDVILGSLYTNVTSGCEHVTVLANLVKFRDLAKARYVSILARIFIAAPSVICAGDFGEIFVRQFAMYAVNHCAELARVDE